MKTAEEKGKTSQAGLRRTFSFARKPPMEEEIEKALRIVVSRERFTRDEVAGCINAFPIRIRAKALELLTEIAGYKIGALAFSAITKKVQLDANGRAKVDILVEEMYKCEF